ncbi:MAG: DUF523 and DUF1722 domain-containing protein [Phycisphaerae bacterium]|nr:DUF523 and DUF1722 domain-containing protein [Phycisphaerae bacterium]
MTTPNEKIRLGISTCLLGEPVRYDGGQKRDDFLVDTLGQYVQWVPICPEVECGLPVPREAMRLVGDAESPRLLTIRTKIDHTDRMLGWAARRVGELEREGLCGFVFKSKSPSSGMERVKIYDDAGNSRKVGVGLFARTFMQRFPLLPVEDEGRLHDPLLRENFIERVFCLKRYRDMLAQGGGRRRLVEFQTDHKILLMSHSAELMRRMGHLVGRADQFSPADLTAEYERLMLQALKLTATVRKHVNALQHMMGHLRHGLSADEKQELLDVIGRYHAGLVPLVVPITLLQHHVRRHKVEYLSRQVYLNPHPLELKLRNHA